MLIVIVATGATVRLTGLGPRLPALARLPARRSVPEEGLPLVRRVLEPRRRVLHRARDARARRRGLAHARARPPREDPRDARLRRHARPGAARRGHRLLPPEPVARDLAPAAVAPRARPRRGRAARGDAARCAAVRPRCRGSRAPAAPCCSPRCRCSSSPARSRRRPARIPAASPFAGSARSSRRSRCTCGQPPCSASSSSCSRPGRGATATRYGWLLRGCAGLLALLLAQMAIGEIQYRNALP